MRNNNAEMKNCNNLKINQVLFEILVRLDNNSTINNSTI